MRTEHQKKLQTELDALNKEVEDTLAKRTTWMNAHMEDFSDFKVGDEVYNPNTGTLLGVVSRLYRYHQDGDPRYDDHMDVEIEYRMTGSKNCFDNSSRHAGGGPSFGTREDALQTAKSRAEYLAWKARGSDWSEFFK
jgi:hypothetical protein